MEYIDTGANLWITGGIRSREKIRPRNKLFDKMRTNFQELNENYLRLNKRCFSAFLGLL